MGEEGIQYSVADLVFVIFGRKPSTLDRYPSSFIM